MATSVQQSAHSRGSLLKLKDLRLRLPSGLISAMLTRAAPEGRFRSFWDDD
jgi:hypothetical protein